MGISALGCLQRCCNNSTHLSRHFPFAMWACCSCHKIKIECFLFLCIWAHPGACLDQENAFQQILRGPQASGLILSSLGASACTCWTVRKACCKGVQEERWVLPSLGLHPAVWGCPGQSLHRNHQAPHTYSWEMTTPWCWVLERWK